MYPSTIVAAVLILLRPAEAAAKGALSKQLWEPLLTFADKMRPVSGRATAKLNSEATRRSNLAVLQSQIAVFVTGKNNNATTAEFGPIMMALGKLMQTMVDTDPILNQEAVAAAAHGEYLRGAAKEFFNIAAGAYQGAANARLTTNNKGQAAGNGINGISGIAGAKDKLAAPTAEPSTDDLDDVTADGFASLKANQGIKDNELSTAASGNSCTLFSSGTSGLLSTTGVSGTLKFTLGYLKRPNAADTGETSDGTKVAPNTAGTTASDLPEYSKAHAAIYKLKSPSSAADISDVTGHAALTEMPELKTAINNLILKKKGEPAAGDTSTINKHIADYYTPRKDDFSKFWQKLKEVTLPVEIRGTQATTLDQVRDLRQLAGALAFYAKKKRQRPANQNSRTSRQK
ncbi:Trypanosome variant surface glycoprotein (A-type), putative [Trypanosoma equiperdum]|uniref:Trypanosome variant surface glycoprotein (A-type), putative n=1 Tax=Trypanosoma equiperdum TaxID=5694 RepID=A0A1G4I9P7_TRYEQ|nr:Trypanosome variant surface glycoprotein (A-type), putative [Trypanosoma equiperdum]